MKILISFLLLVSFLFADRDGGPYIGIGYGLSKFDDKGYYAEVIDPYTKAPTLYAGAYINENLSVEVSYVNFYAHGLDDGYMVSDINSTKKNIDLYVTTVSTLAHYAFFNDTLDFYGRFGVGNLALTGVSDSGFTFVYGAGVAIRFNEMFAWKIAYDMYDFDYDDTSDINNVVRYDMKIDYLYSAIEVQF